MIPSSLLQGLACPLRSPACLLAWLVFWAGLCLVVAAARAGFIYLGLAIPLAVVLVPGIIRFAVSVADAASHGREAEPPGIESFTLSGTAWSLFAGVPFIAWPLALAWASGQGTATMLATALVGAALLPALTGALIATHECLPALDPRRWLAIARLAGPAYLLPVAFLLLLATVLAWGGLPAWLAIGAGLYGLLAFAAMTGAMLHAAGLDDAIEIDTDEDVAEVQSGAASARERRQCLGHAYALCSRGNSAAGLDHLERSLASDPDPGAACAAYQEALLRWEDPWPALAYGQRRLGRLLAAGEQRAAVKLMLRLRLLDERFRPAAVDLPAAIAAAETTGNTELAAVLAAPDS